MKPYTEPFNRWVAVSVILHAALFGAAAFGDVLFPANTPFGWNDGGPGSVVQVKMSGAPGLELPPPPSVNPGSKPSDSPSWQPEAEPSSKPPKPAPTPPKAGPKDPKPPVSTKGIAIPDPEAPKKTSSEPSGQIASAASVLTPANAAVIGGNSGGTADIQYGRRSSGTGTASVGFSERAFGDRFGWYADALTAAVSQYWQPAPGAAQSPKVSLVFVINKDGSVTNVEYDQKSNNDALNTSARRAIMQAAATKGIPPLPGDFKGSSIKARLSFEYTVR